jgi:hypothetical protein
VPGPPGADAFTPVVSGGVLRIMALQYPVVLSAGNSRAANVCVSDDANACCGMASSHAGSSFGPTSTGVVLTWSVKSDPSWFVTVVEESTLPFILGAGK